MANETPIETNADQQLSPVATTPVSPLRPQDSAETTSKAVSSPATAGPLDAKNTPASTGAKTEQPAKDWQKEYESLDKANKELRVLMQRQGKEKNEANSRFDSLEKTLKQLSEGMAPLLHKETYDPNQFMEDLRSQGPQFVLDLVKKQREAILADTDAKVNGLSATVTQLQTERAVERRQADKDSYPDFKELEQDMVKTYESNRALFDSQYENLEDKIDALYNAAKLQRSPDALKQAEALGRKKSEEELAREAHAAGAGGGKAGAVTVPSLHGATAAQQKEWFKRNRPELVED